MAVRSGFSLPRALLLAATLLVWLIGADNLNQTYCSTQNTGASNGATYWQFQSNGWCHDHCVDSFAFAIVQDFNCWCSNFAPAAQQDVSDCSETCPGFPPEQCGNPDKGLFGYVELTIKPSGTAADSAASKTGGSQSPSAQPSASSTSSSTPSSSTVAESVVQTSQSSQSSSSSSSSTVSSARSHSVSTSASASSSTPTTPYVSVQVVTESGSPITKLITITPTPDDSSQKSSGMSSGAIAGAVVGGVAGLGALIGLILWYLSYRRRRQQDIDDYEAGENGKANPQRHASTLSKAGLLRSEKRYPPVTIPAPTRHSSNGTGGVSPVSHGGSGSERRHSKPLFYDQRLNPSALMDLDNGSHTSIVSIEDNRDYTRTLNVRNPDPPEH